MPTSDSEFVVAEEAYVRFLEFVGRRLADFLSKPVARGGTASPPTDPEMLAVALKPADILLVEGRSRISTAIKYLTQSTWSHAALYAGTSFGTDAKGRGLVFIEADPVAGVRAVPLETFADLHTRICRPVGLSDAEARQVVRTAAAQIGHRYDLKNVFDLARYLLPTPPVPVAWRRRMLALGSGDPTRAICSTLVAQAFQSVRYPILPKIEQIRLDDPDCRDCVRQISHVRHHSLFVPRDFDVSPYFEIIKPTLDLDFDFRTLEWAEDDNPETTVAEPVVAAGHDRNPVAKTVAGQRSHRKANSPATPAA